MQRPGILLKRSIIFIHRWLGVALSVLFMLWFCSGIVMMYWSFPEVTTEQRLERAPVLDAGRITLSPEQAYARLHRDDPPGQVRLSSFDGRPVYRFSGEAGGRTGQRRDGAQAVVYADDGSVQNKINDALIDRVAATWARQPLSSAKKEAIEQVDQWTVAAPLRSLRPLYKYSFSDGQQVYVSGSDAEVAQYTTTQSRLWAYLGAIPHWMYFTGLRKNQPQWFQFVVWSSGMGALTALLGIIVALWMLSPSKRYRHAGEPTSIPYREWKRWHTIAGLAFGIVTLTWAFSGMLSMGPFAFVERLTGNRPARGGENGGRRAPSSGRVNIPEALRGAARFNLAAWQAKSPAQTIAESGAGFQIKEMEFTMFDGEPVYIATSGSGDTRMIPVTGAAASGFEPGRIMRIARRAAGASLAEVRTMDEYDAYYLDRNGKLPLPVVYLRLNDQNQTRYYIDVKTGQVAGSYNTRNWVNRWLYHGLHSLDFPWLYKHRPLWDIVVIALMLGGTAVCLTSLVLAWRVLKRKFMRLLPSGAVMRPAQSEDLSPI